MSFADRICTRFSERVDRSLAVAVVEGRTRFADKICTGKRLLALLGWGEGLKGGRLVDSKVKGLMEKSCKP